MQTAKKRTVNMSFLIMQAMLLYPTPSINKGVSSGVIQPKKCKHVNKICQNDCA